MIHTESVGVGLPFLGVVMISSVREWVSFLQTSDAVLGLPLLIAGLGLSLFGWRLWRACVVVAFGLGGMALGAALAGQGPDQILYAVACGAVLALVSYWPINYSLALLGGAVGGGFLLHFLESVGFSGTVLWLLGGLALIACSAVAFINRQLVVIAVTSFLGAALVISGLTVFCVKAAPNLFATAQSLSYRTSLIVVFILLVPSVMSGFYQIAEIRRVNADL